MVEGRRRGEPSSSEQLPASLSFGHFAASGEGDRRGEDDPEPPPLKSLPDNTKSSRSAWGNVYRF